MIEDGIALLFYQSLFQHSPNVLSEEGQNGSSEKNRHFGRDL